MIYLDYVAICGRRCVIRLLLLVPLVVLQKKGVGARKAADKGP